MTAFLFRNMAFSYYYYCVVVVVVILVNIFETLVTFTMEDLLI